MECPICFTAYDDNERKPVQTFCRCHQHLCLLCLRQLVKHFTYCPWDRTRWSGRQLLQKFLDATPPNFLQLLNERTEERGQKRVEQEQEQEEVDVDEQRRLLEIFALVRRDRDFALNLQQRESARQEEGTERRKASDSNKRKRDLLSFYSPSPSLSPSPAAQPSSSAGREEGGLEIADESPWNCRRCSFLNHGLLQCCELCDALRQRREESQRAVK
eukprot:gene10783-11984_t